MTGHLRLPTVTAIAAALVVSGLICLASACTSRQFAAPYEIVIEGGRVIDPETGLDAVRNVGINGGTIARIAERPLLGGKA